MKDLIEKLKAATDGSRELDVAVWNAVNPDCPNVAVLEHGSVQLRDRKLQEKKVSGFSIVTWTGSDDWAVPSYTTSMDAALLLVPEKHDGWSCNVQNGICQALIFKDGDGVIGRGDAATPELAICAAALEAS